MKLNQINESLTFLTNLGVLVGIIFLAVELKQNTDFVKAQTRDSMTEKVLTNRYQIATNPELAGLFAGENIIENPVFDADFFMLTALIDANIRIWENEWYQFRQGLFDEEEMEGRRYAWEFTLVREPKYISYWNLRRGTYSASFTEEIDSIIERNNLPNSQ